MLRTSRIRSQSVPRPGRVLPLSRRERFGPTDPGVDSIPHRAMGDACAAKAGQLHAPFDVSSPAAPRDAQSAIPRGGAVTRLTAFAGPPRCLPRP